MHICCKKCSCARNRAKNRIYNYQHKSERKRPQYAWPCQSSKTRYSSPCQHSEESSMMYHCPASTETLWVGRRSWSPLIELINPPWTYSCSKTGCLHQMIWQSINRRLAGLGPCSCNIIKNEIWIETWKEQIHKEITLTILEGQEIKNCV